MPEDLFSGFISRRQGISSTNDLISYESLFVMYLQDKRSLCCCPSKNPCFCTENRDRLTQRTLVAKTQLYVLISLKQNFYVYHVDLIDFDIVKSRNQQKPPTRVKTKDNHWPLMHSGSAENLTHSSNYDILFLLQPVQFYRSKRNVK